jgi:hypothetical protein
MAERDNDVATLRQSLRAFGNSGRIYPAMNGVVQSVNESNYTCQVLLDDGSEITASLTCGDKAEGVVQIPKKNSDVVVVCFDSINSVVVMCDQTDKIIINGGTLGGLPISSNIAQHLNNIEKDINDLKQVFSTWVVSPNDGGGALKSAASTWAGATLQQTSEDDLQNEKIKQ